MRRLLIRDGAQQAPLETIVRLANQGLPISSTNLQTKSKNYRSIPTREFGGQAAVTLRAAQTLAAATEKPIATTVDIPFTAIRQNGRFFSLVGLCCRNLAGIACSR